jgi:hypothetical protein
LVSGEWNVKTGMANIAIKSINPEKNPIFISGKEKVHNLMSGQEIKWKTMGIVNLMQAQPCQ